jgi:hypothetical protein
VKHDASATTIDLVERQVRALLKLSPAFQQMAADRQRQMARDMVRIGAYLAEPEGISANRLGGAIAVVPARTSAQAVDKFLDDVNFPQFVTALIRGVFQSIVDSSIQQMEAYADLVKNAAKTVDQFAGDSVSDAHSRDWLAKTYPDYFERDAHNALLRLRPGADQSQAIERLCLLPLDSLLQTLDPDSIEKKLVPAGRRRIVATRQQLLATMVLMGR